MLRAKRRRASKYNTKGRQIFSTLNTNVKYKQQLNVQNGEIKTDCSYNPVPCNCSYNPVPYKFANILPPIGKWHYNETLLVYILNNKWILSNLNFDNRSGLPYSPNNWVWGILVDTDNPPISQISLNDPSNTYNILPWTINNQNWIIEQSGNITTPALKFFRDNVILSGVSGQFISIDYKTKYTGCKTNTQRNPLSGYRKDNILSSIADCSKIPTNTVYTDNYARNKPGQNGTVCSLVVEGSGCVYDLSSCIQYKQYNPTVQNKHGYINDAYNYSTKQYLSRRNDTYTKRAFNFLSNKKENDNKFSIKNSWDPSDNKCYNNSIYNGDLLNRWRDKNKNNGFAVYKPNNRGFSQQGAVSGGARLNRLKYQTQLKAQICCIQTPNTIENKKHNNVINGAYPATLYYNGTPVHKEIISNVKTANCKRTQSGIAQRCHIKSNFCI